MTNQTVTKSEYEYNPLHALGTCGNCGMEMTYNVPRLGARGGYCHTHSGSPDCDGKNIATRLKVGAVYLDTDGNLFVCADDEPDSQFDVRVINFDGSYGFAHFELCEGDEKVAESLAEYLHNVAISHDSGGNR